MTEAKEWVKRALFRSAWFAAGCVAIGMFIAWAVINLSAGPGTVILSQEEAEGPRFSDPNTLDIITHFNRRRACPTMTQRWVWRWTTYDGKRIQQAIPLISTASPFLADGDELMTTLPSQGVPDRDSQWFYRTVVTEQCGFLPAWASGLFGNRIYRSPDQPVNFIGAPHGK